MDDCGYDYDYYAPVWIYLQVQDENGEWVKESKWNEYRVHDTDIQYVRVDSYVLKGIKKMYKKEWDEECGKVTAPLEGIDE